MRGKQKRVLILAVSGVALVALLASAFFAFSRNSQAASPSANPNSNGYTIANNTPGFIKKATDLGAADPSSVITVTAWLKLHNENQLDQLVHQQRQKGSANYHKWLSQGQFDASYSPTSQEAKSVQNFLSAHNLSVVTVAENNWYVKVQGTVGDIQKAFHVQIHNYKLNGATYRSNTGNPNVNDSSGAHIAAISGMDDYGYQPMISYPRAPDGQTLKPIPLASHPNGAFFSAECFRAPETDTFTGTGVSATYTGNRYGQDITSGFPNLPPCGYQPSEMQTAYNMNALYAGGFDGTGQTVVITDAFGSPTISDDAEVFSQIYGLPDLTPENFQVLRAPGAVNSKVCNPHGLCSAGWADEITLDVEWVHAMAPKAHIALVIGPNNGSDLDEAINW